MKNKICFDIENDKEFYALMSVLYEYGFIWESMGTKFSYSGDIKLVVIGFMNDNHLYYSSSKEHVEYDHYKVSEVNNNKVKKILKFYVDKR